jgi:hypothetical protein
MKRPSRLPPGGSSNSLLGLVRQHHRRERAELLSDT